MPDRCLSLTFHMVFIHKGKSRTSYRIRYTRNPAQVMNECRLAGSHGPMKGKHTAFPDAGPKVACNGIDPAQVKYPLHDLESTNIPITRVMY
jgi:hypothetical protein